jgi:hypothetical protein
VKPIHALQPTIVFTTVSDDVSNKGCQSPSR